MRYVVRNEEGLYLAPLKDEKTWVKFLTNSRIFNNITSAKNAMMHTDYEGSYQVHTVKLLLRDAVE